VKFVDYLSNALSTNTTLISINLRYNNIGDKGAEYLSNALSTNTTLTNINLSLNNIGNKGAEYLSNAILNNPSLVNIDGTNLNSLQCRNIYFQYLLISQKISQIFKIKYILNIYRATLFFYF
jgi:Ran GTPase-activating protein (RanGAP) involved in mRNA processing and transport